MLLLLLIHCRVVSLNRLLLLKLPENIRVALKILLSIVYDFLGIVRNFVFFTGQFAVLGLELYVVEKFLVG